MSKNSNKAMLIEDIYNFIFLLINRISHHRFQGNISKMHYIICSWIYYYFLHYGFCNWSSWKRQKLRECRRVARRLNYNRELDVLIGWNNYWQHQFAFWLAPKARTCPTFSRFRLGRFGPRHAVCTCVQVVCGMTVSRRICLNRQISDCLWMRKYETYS